MMNSPPFQTVKRHLGHLLILSFPDFGKHKSLFRVQNFWPTQRSSVEKKIIFIQNKKIKLISIPNQQTAFI